MGGKLTRYQALLMDTPDITLKVCQMLNPTILLPVAKGGDLLHQRIETREQIYSSRSDLLDEPHDSPEVERLTDGSSFVEMGTRKAGYATVSLDEVTEAKALSPQTSAQKAELSALTRALQLGKDKKLNIFTDSKYGFHMLHAHAAIWKERGMLTARNSPIKHKDLILAFLEAVQPPTQVAVAHCRGHQRDGSFVSQGNSKADQIAEQAAQLQEPEQVMALVIGPPELPSLPQYSPHLNYLAFPSIPHRNKKMLRNGAMRREAQAGI